MIIGSSLGFEYCTSAQCQYFLPNSLFFALISLVLDIHVLVFANKDGSL